MTEQELLYAPQEDIELFNKVIAGLPNDPLFSCGPHSIKAFRYIADFVKPKSIFEIGFNIGISASLWLELVPDAFLTSVDISKRPETVQAVHKLTHDNYRFAYVDRKDEAKLSHAIAADYDLAFIDGDHEFEGVVEDIRMCLAMKIPWFAFDDMLEQFGPGVQPAIDKFPQLVPIHQIGNIALYKNISVYDRED